MNSRNVGNILYTDWNPISGSENDSKRINTLKTDTSISQVQIIFRKGYNLNLSDGFWYESELVIRKVVTMVFHIIIVT
ncbi:unnamed protein product [Gordionus sp. m RMFG-2023]